MTLYALSFVLCIFNQIVICIKYSSQPNSCQTHCLRPLPSPLPPAFLLPHCLRIAHCPRLKHCPPQSLVRYVGEVHRGVRGFILDPHGQPIEDASLKIAGRDVGFTSTKYGEYWRVLLPGNYKIEVSTGECCIALL